VDRRANARVLRARIDELLAKDPNTDILIGGDLNSQYNQRQRYRATMRETGINDVLRAQGNELAIRGKDRDLYNLWFELPSDQRASDHFRGEWGTLMHIILSRGLYDYRGVQYEDNSFTVMRIPGVNANELGLPLRWQPEPAPGRGYSDHFPLLARFRVVDDDRTDRWLSLTRGSTEDDPSGEALTVDFAPPSLFATARRIADLPEDTDLRDGSHSGRIFLVEGKGHLNDRGHVKIMLGDLEWDVFSHKPELRNELRQRVRDGKKLRFYGELGTYRGQWQFVVQDERWLR